MAFVLLLLLSVSTLTQVEVQSAAAQQDSLKAKQNAILGLKTAIGQLQKLTGPDTRITAPAESIADVNGSRNVTGVWRSWEGRNHHTSGSQAGKAFAPDYTSKLSTGKLDPNSTSAARFIGWLCSDALTNQDPTNPPKLTEIADTTVPLLSSKTLGKDRTSDEVHLTPSVIDSGNHGKYAWWISGENSKAQLKHEVSPTTSEGWSKRLSTFSHPDANVFGLQNDSSLGKVDSLSGYNLIPLQTSSASSLESYQSLFHDLTAWSRGLLTNVATGGWKRDLSLMTEDWDRLPEKELPFFTLEPGIETAASKASENLRPSQLLIYPWLSPMSNNVAPPYKQCSSVVSWNALQDYCTQYRNITNSNGTVSMPAFAGRTSVLSDLNDFRDKVRRYPIVARMHYVFSYSAELNSDPNAPATEAYIACLDMNPAITLWNPYNVTLEVESPTIEVFQPTPAAFTFTKHIAQNNPNGSNTYVAETYEPVSINEILQDKNLKLTLHRSVGSSIISLQPGESIIFSAQHNSPISGSQELNLYPGYRTRGGFRYDKLNYTETVNNGTTTANYGNIKGGKDDLISATVDLNAGHQGQKGGQVGLRMLILNENNEQIGFHYCTQYQAPKGGITVTNPDPSVSPPGDHLKLSSLGGLPHADPTQAAIPQPFLTAFLTQRVATNEFANESEADGRGVGAKGFLNSNPLAFYTRSSMAYESPYLFKFFALNGVNSNDGVPESNDDNSFIGMHYRAAYGLTHIITSELPLNPIQSLAQLQHFDIANNNQNRPYTPYAIGNSHAQPFFGTKEVFAPSGEADKPDRYDHSYMANHLLFDDWFVSSIAPETHSWDSSIYRTKEEVYQDHLLQNIPLPNSAYLPRSLAHSESEAVDRTDADLSPNTAWHNIASKIEVEGMFNINSTSVTAWSAILRNLRNAKMPRTDYTSSGWAIGLDTSISDETPISRTSIAGNPSTSVGNKYELGTFSSLSDQQIDALAEEIVAQIKLRGPFLSLSEFVNRQLSTNKSLAMAGAIEAALLQLSEDGTSKNPNANIQTHFVKQTEVNSWLRKKMDFPEAVDGYAAYGFPGWVRQADILRSLAPVLSARDDTFIIRSYGESNDITIGKKVSKMWCEAVVQRKADYVMPTDNSTILPSSSTLTANENVRFGRRYEIIAFRWLSPDNI